MQHKPSKQTADTRPDQSRFHQALDGAAITAISTVMQGFGQILVLAMLARHISTTEFGLMTATMVVIGFGRQVAEAMIRPVIVQSQELKKQDIGTASTLSWLFGILAMYAMLTVAEPIAGFLSEPQIIPVISVLSCVFLIQAPGLVAEGIIQRNLEFGRLAQAEILSFLLGYTLVGVALALYGAGVWALVWANIAQVSIKSLYLIVLKPAALRCSFNRHSARHILWLACGFSTSKLLNHLATQADYLVVATAMNSSALGIYGRAYQLVSMPAMLFGQVFEKVMFPVYSRLQQDRAKVAEYYGYAVALSAQVMVPISVCLVVLAPEIIRLVLGPNWADAVVPLQILGASLIFRMGYKINDPLTKGLGLVYRRSWRLAIYLAAVIAFASLGVNWGLAGVSIGVSIAIILNFLLMAHLSLSSLNASWSWFARQHTRGFLAACCLLPFTWWLATSLRASGMSYVLTLLGVIALVLLSLITAALLFPRLVIGVETRWLAHKLGSRLLPRAQIPELAERRDELVSVFVGLSSKEQHEFLAQLSKRLMQHGVKASALPTHPRTYLRQIIRWKQKVNQFAWILRHEPRSLASLWLLLIGSPNSASADHSLIASCTRLINGVVYLVLVSKGQLIQLATYSPVADSNNSCNEHHAASHYPLANHVADTLTMNRRNFNSLRSVK